MPEDYKTTTKKPTYFVGGVPAGLFKIPLTPKNPHMPKNGPLVVIDEDVQEQKLICKALDEIRLKNRIQLCFSAEQALDFLENTTEKPFLILTKTALPGISGLEFQAKVMETEHLRSRSVPLIFFSDTDAPNVVGRAYRMRAQGYFVMPKDFISLKLSLLCITDYWQRAVHPSTVDHKLHDMLE